MAATTKSTPAQEDAPLNVGPRDALLDPQPEDYIPDNEEKGYHAGLERQGGPEESKFDHGSLDELKAAHNAQEGDKDSTPVSPEPTAEEVSSPSNAGKVAKA